MLVVDPDAAPLAADLGSTGFRVRTAATGHEAVAIVGRASDTIDVIVSEVLLPGPSGYQLVQHLRAAAITIPIVLLSTKDGEYDQADGLDLGADAYLIKPVSPLVLGAHLRALLRRRPADRHRVGEARDGAPFGRERMRIGPMEMDPATCHITVAGRTAHLGPLEYALLWVLATHPYGPVSTRELATEVWGHRRITLNTVQVYIAYLRRTLDTLGVRHMLRTVYGQGYRLDPNITITPPPDKNRGPTCATSTTR